LQTLGFYCWVHGPSVHDSMNSVLFLLFPNGAINWNKIFSLQFTFAIRPTSGSYHSCQISSNLDYVAFVVTKLGVAHKITHTHTHPGVGHVEYVKL